MKKETYAFIIGLGIGYGVKKFIENPVNRVTGKVIYNVKRKVADEMYRVIMGGTPEEVVEARKRESPYGYKNGRHMISGLDLITFETRKEAAQVLNEMRDLISDYSQCSVEDYYEINGHDYTFTDYSRGWTNLEDARISSHHGKFYIDLPSPKLLR